MSGKPSRADYPYFQRITTRWKDNDVYGHVNNVEYYSYFDTVINTLLIREAGLDIHAGDTIGVCAESHCRFTDSLAFPDAVDAGLRIARLGNSSVRYEVGIFKNDEADASAAGHFIHVFVDRQTNKPAGIPKRIRDAFETILVEGEA